MYKRKPISGKKKKQILQKKRARKQQEVDDDEENDTVQNNTANKGRRGRNIISNVTGEHRLKTVFEGEDRSVIEQRKLDSMKPLDLSKRKKDNKAIAELGKTISIPVRPSWSSNMTPEELDSNEKNYFTNYLDWIYNNHSFYQLNYFEHNLEVWRQLWRACEISNLLCVLADIRHPLFHFPPSLYYYIAHVLSKQLILVLTKCDLVPTSIIEKWMNYFRKNFPKVKLVCVASFHFDAAQVEGEAQGAKRKVIKRSAKTKYNLSGLKPLIEELNVFIKEKGGQLLPIPESSSLTNHLEKVMKESRKDEQDSDEDEEESNTEEGSNEDEKEQTNSNLKYKITIGFIGSPNVGKSTLINALYGRKKCSESRTPGHTKHIQTLIMNKDVRLCDCPGLVFPAINIPKQLQIICGIFPIAQVREPYSSIQFVAERIPLEEIYKLQLEEGVDEWSAFGLCESYARWRGYLSKTGRPDPYRAGSEILRNICEGKLIFYFEPPDEPIDFSLYESNQTSKPFIIQSKDDEQENSEEKNIEETDEEGIISDESSSSSEEEIPTKFTNKFSLLDQ